jgi:hypothetical protein
VVKRIVLLLLLTCGTAFAQVSGPDVSQSLVATGTLAGAGQTVTLALYGRTTISVQFSALTLASTLVQVSYSMDNGVSYVTSGDTLGPIGFELKTGLPLTQTLPSFAGAASTRQMVLTAPPGATHIRITSSTFTGGSATVTMRASSNPGLISRDLADRPDNTTGYAAGTLAQGIGIATMVGGVFDQTDTNLQMTNLATAALRIDKYRALNVQLRGPFSNDAALKTTSDTFTAGVTGMFVAGGVNPATNLINAMQQEPTYSGLQVTQVNRPLPVSLSFNESVAAPLATTWYQRIKWTPPAATYFRPARAMSAVTTAGSRTMIVEGISLGTFDVSSNAFVDGSAVSSPYHFSRMIGCVTTVMSAVANTVTATYVDELGNAGNATAALAIPSASPVGTCFEFVLTATAGSMRDAGVRDVSAVVDTAAPTGVLQLWGINVLHDALGVANGFESSSPDDYVLDSTRTVMILEQQAATTAQQRGATINGSIDTK